MIKYWLEMFVTVVINLTIHPPLVTFLSPKLQSFWPAPWIKSSRWGQNRNSNKNRLPAFCAALEIWKNTWVTVTICYTNGRLPVFSLNLSSAGKGPFMAGKAKNMCQRRTFLGLSSLKRHSLILRPILRKSAVIFRQQLKTFDSNNFTFFNALFPQCVAHKEKSCAYFITLPYIYLLPWSDRISTCIFFKVTYLILVSFQAVAGSKNFCFRQ